MTQTHSFIPRGTLPAPALCDVCGKSGFDPVHEDPACEECGADMYQDPSENWWCTHCDNMQSFDCPG